MKIFVFTTLLLFMIKIVCAQDETHNISQQEAKTLLRSLNQTSADTVRADHLLRLALYNILKPGEYKPDLDSAATFINEAESVAAPMKSPVMHGYIAWVKSNFYREKGQKEQGKKFAENAVALLNNTPDKYHLGSAYLEMAHYYQYNDAKQGPEKIRLVEQSVKALEHSSYIELRAYALQFLADLYSTQSRDIEALHTIKLSLEAYQSIHYKKLQGAYNVCAGIYYDLSDYRDALNYELEALKLAEALNDTGMTGVIYNQLGEIYDSALDKKNAKKYYMLAMENARQRHDLPSIALILLNVIIDYDYLNQNKEGLKFINSLPERDSLGKVNSFSVPYAFLIVYSGLNQNTETELYIKQLQQYIELNRPADRRLSRIYARFVKYYTRTLQFAKAKFYFKKVDSLDKVIGDHFAIAWDYFLQFKLDSTQGNYRGALYNLSKFNSLHDSLLNETKTRQLKQIQVVYETEKKENEIKLKDKDIRLLNQTNEIQLGNLHHAQSTKNWITAGSIMVLVIAGLLYRQSRIRKKNNLVITHKNELLQHLLTEKEWLLKEVHHRVKNNLHTVICLLESQAAYLENDALKAIENSQHRIYAMSLIHQKLYQSDDIKTIDMGSYIPELVRSLEDSFGVTSQIQFKLNIAPVNLDISHAIPLGLIINEAVTNSIKYAFPDNRQGEISILLIGDGDRIKLELADNGIGMQEIIKETESGSLGLELMKGLSEDIDADIDFKIENGTKITIKFKPDALNAPQSAVKLADTKEMYQ